MRKWMSYNAEFLDEEEVVRITNEQFVPIRRDDLLGNIDIDISISTAEDNSAKAQELSFLLQTMGPNQDFEINKLLMAEIARLSRMPELEQKILGYQPQPDPAAEQMKQMQMQEMQLKLQLMQAEIKDKLARAGENEIDAQVKVAKMKTELAKARKLGSEADGMDLDFLLKNDGVDGYEKKLDDEEKYMRDRRAKLEDDEYDRFHEMDKMTLQAILNRNGE